MIRIQVGKCQPETRKEEAKEKSGEERLPKEQWKNVEMSGSLRERRSEEMTQSNTSSPRDSEVPLESQRVITIKIPKNKEICGEGKNGVEKEVGFAIRQKKANKESINLKVRKRRRVMKMMTPLLAYWSSGERMLDRE